jgi:pimeloyl-ACP methyl ester carboxylesterase
METPRITDSSPLEPRMEAEVEADVEEADEASPSEPSGWSRFLSAVARAAGATGRGFAALYRLSTENAHFLRPVLNGFVGDQLAVEGQGIHMGFRRDGRNTELDDLDLHRRLVGPGRTVVVMVHGLMCDEVIFSDTRFSSTAPHKPGHGARLEQELGATVLYLRYNSGLHISENGRALAQLLDQLVDHCGQRLSKLVLVGHSMGGLVIRSAGYYGTAEARSWPERLRAMVLISTPQQGSYVEQLANLASFVLHRIPNFYTALSGALIDQRSDGIKDLRFGLMADQDWRDHPYDDRLFAKRTPIELLPGVDYHVLVGTLPENDDSLVARFFGDGLMSKRSAMGRDESQARPSRTTYQVFPSMGHFDILIHPDVGHYVTEVVRASLEDATSPNG